MSSSISFSELAQARLSELESKDTLIVDCSYPPRLVKPQLQQKPWKIHMVISEAAIYRIIDFWRLCPRATFILEGASDEFLKRIRQLTQNTVLKFALTQMSFSKLCGECRDNLENPEGKISAYTEIADCYAIQGHYDHAIKHLEAALKALWQPVIAEQLAVYLRHRERHSEAESLLRKILDENPDALTARASLGDCLRKQGKYDEAIEHLRVVVAKKPDSTFALESLGVCLLEQKKPTEAQAYFEQSLAYDPNSQWALTKIADCLIIQTKLRDAAEYLKKALEITPILDSLLEKLYSCLQSCEAHAEAEMYLKRALSLCKQSTPISYLLGDCLRMQEKHAEALPHLQYAHRQSPKDPRCKTCLAECLINLDKLDEAKSLYTEALQLASDQESELREFIQERLQNCDEKLLHKQMENLTINN